MSKRTLIYKSARNKYEKKETIARRKRITGTVKNSKGETIHYEIPKIEIRPRSYRYDRMDNKPRVYLQETDLPRKQQREILDAVLRHMGIDPKSVKPRWSWKAGCSCPCSPGYIVDHAPQSIPYACDVFPWVNRSDEDPNESAFARSMRVREGGMTPARAAIVKAIEEGNTNFIGATEDGELIPITKEDEAA